MMDLKAGFIEEEQLCLNISYIFSVICQVYQDSNLDDKLFLCAVVITATISSVSSFCRVPKKALYCSACKRPAPSTRPSYARGSKGSQEHLGSLHLH
jgi:hypothetical protein